MKLIWTLTDGKAGDRVQCLGVAERIAGPIAARIEERTVRPRVPFEWAMPWGPPDPRDLGVLDPPFPDIAIASGRRAIAYVRRLKALAPSCFTVVLKDPRTRSGADLVWVPEHDRLRGPQVIATLTSPHRLTPERLQEAGAAARPAIRDLPSPRVAVLVGGPSKGSLFSAKDVADLSTRLQALAATGSSLMVTFSRRTPPTMRTRIEAAVTGPVSFVSDDTGDNPYLEILACADAIVVTADSVNMVGEAASTGRPILLFEPSALDPKIRRFLDGLRRHGAVAKFTGRLETFTYKSLDSTPLIAREILRRYEGMSKP